jgi:hypothetical protein
MLRYVLVEENGANGPTGTAILFCDVYAELLSRPVAGLKSDPYEAVEPAIEVPTVVAN